MRVLAGESIDDEVEMRLDDGMRVFREVLAPIREGDVIAGAVGVNIAITEKRRSEEALRASLAEKEVLLREVHHRVKNNFQVIISLLNLQSRSVSNDDIRRNLLDAQNRIRAMALIHEKVYRSVNLAEIDFGEYLKSLAGDLRRLYVPATGRIELTVEAEHLILPVDKAIPCGLVVNELLTNALKYAFPGEQSGAVRVQAGMSGADAVRVVVSDNGIGLPAGMEPEKSDTLGLKLVQILVSGQMKGSVKFVQDNGTAVEVVFPRITVE
jgi:two-component sensor histidine kinase